LIRKDIIKDVLKLALPAVGEMVLYMMIWVLDTMMVGKYGGETAVSTVGLSSEIMYSFVNVFISVGISVGTVSLISRKLGSKDTTASEEFATLGLAIGSMLALIISSVAFIFAPKILFYSGARDTVLSNGIIYMKITSIGLFFNMLMNVLNSILRAGKNTKIPLLASGLINIINLFLDWVLIFGKLGFPELGIRGAAIATAIAHIVGFIFITFYTFKKSPIKPHFKFIRNINTYRAKELVKLSIPSSMQEGVFSMIRLLGTILIMYLGKTAFAANQITTTIESISFMPGNGVAIAATTLVGHKIGEKDLHGAKEYAYTCTLIGTSIMLMCSIAFLLFPKLLISLFIKPNELEVIGLGTLCLMIASIEQPFMAISMILGGALKGIGDTKTPFMVSLISSWIIRFPLLLIFIYKLNLSVIYVWWITAIQWSFEGIVIFILFKRKFKKLMTPT